jgi:hypothetical protein
MSHPDISESGITRKSTMQSVGFNNRLAESNFSHLISSSDQLSEFIGKTDLKDRGTATFSDLNMSFLTNSRRFSEISASLTESFIWSIDLGKDLWSQSKCGSVIPKLKNKHLQNQIEYLYHMTERRDLYYNLCERYDIRRRCFLEGPEFAKYCKKSIENGFILHHQVYPSPIEGYKRFDSMIEYFPHSYLIHWKEKSDDIKYSFLPTKAQTPKMEKIFKDALRSILPNECRFSEYSKCFQDTFKLSSSLLPQSSKTVPHALQNWSSTPSFPKEFRTKRAVIPIEPANYRDAVILEPDGLLLVTTLNYKVREILKRVKGSLMGLNDVALSRRIEKMLDLASKGYSYGRDYKKEGLARPRFLISWTLDILQERFPNEFDFAFALEKWSLLLDEDIEGVGKANEVVYPPRGTGLGMANELTTLISCTLAEIVFSKLERHDRKIRNKIKFGVWNDDSGFTGPLDDLMAFFIEDMKLHQKLDYIINTDKTQILKGGGWILGLQKSETFKVDRTYLTRLTLWDKFYAPNISAAKTFVSSLNSCDAKDTLEELIAHWGYEFYKEEVNQPILFGGWIHTKSRGMNTTLDYIDTGDTTLTLRQYKAFKAIEEKATKMRYDSVNKWLTDEKFNHSFINIFHIQYPELKENPFFDLDIYRTDSDAIRQRIIRGFVCSRRQSDYWKATAKLRRHKYSQKIKDVSFIHFKLANLVLDKLKGRMTRLPKWTVIEEEECDWYISRKSWFPKELYRRSKKADKLLLEIGSQCRIEGDQIGSLRYDLELDDLPLLDGYVEPFTGLVMEGTIPFSEKIATEVSDWCPQIFMFINDYNRDEEEIRFCKVPKKVSDLIKLPKKPSIFFATDSERYYLRERDKLAHTFWTPEEARVILRWFDALEKLELRDIKQTPPDADQVVWLEYVLRDLKFPRNLEGKELIKTYTRLWREHKLDLEKKMMEKDPDYLPARLISREVEPLKPMSEEIANYVNSFTSLDDYDIAETPLKMEESDKPIYTQTPEESDDEGYSDIDSENEGYLVDVKGEVYGQSKSSKIFEDNDEALIPRGIVDYRTDQSEQESDPEEIDDDDQIYDDPS